MRYIRRKISTITLFDGNIEDVEDVRKILASLCSHEMDAEIKIKQESVQSFCRIIEVNNIDFKFQIIGRGSLIRHAKIKDIDSLYVVSNDDFVVDIKPGITRWNLLNPIDDGFFEEETKNDSKRSNKTCTHTTEGS